MECEICGTEVENSQELEKHKERMHPPSEGDNLERPDLLGDTPEESAETETPKATH